MPRRPGGAAPWLLWLAFGWALLAPAMARPALAAAAQHEPPRARSHRRHQRGGHPPSRALCERLLERGMPLQHGCGGANRGRPTKLRVAPPPLPGARLTAPPPRDVPGYWVIRGGRAVPATAATPGVSVSYAPTSILDAYDFRSYASGSGQTIAIVDAYGDPTLTSDLAAFNADFSLPAATVNTYQPDGAPSAASSSWADETALDVEWAHAEAPNATIDLIVVPTSGAQQMLDGIAYALNDLSANALSLSWGAAEADYGTAAGTCTYDASTYGSCLAAYDAAFQAAGTDGIPVFVATGDWGAYDTSATGTTPVVQFPSSSPDVIAVGGTTLAMNSAATAYGSETAWSCSNPCSSGGTGGGYSTLETEPADQAAAGIPDSAGMRATPDVSFDANPFSGVYIQVGGNLYVVGGTSFATPSWAAIAVDSRAAGGTAISQSELYALYASALYPDDFHDVTSGNNAYYNAGTGWDATTGIGSPDVGNLIALKPLSVTTTSLGGGTVGSAYSATLAAAGGTPSYTWTLAKGTLPSGCTLSSAGVLSGSPSAAGTYTLTVRVTDSTAPTALTATQSLTLTVTSGSGTLAITTASLPAGAAGASYTATLAATGGTTPYAWSIASGVLPSGYNLNATTGVISGTASAAGTSTFTVEVEDSAAPPADIAKKTLSLTVDAGALAGVEVTPASATLAAGASQGLSARGVDAYGNAIGGLSYSWSASGGTLSAATGSGVTWSATAAGGYSVTATATQSGTTEAGTAALTVDAGALAGVEVTPASATLAAGVGQGLTARGVDAYGNAITGLSYSWSASGGTLSTATGGGVTWTSSLAGSYTVIASVTDGSTSKAGSAAISVGAGPLATVEVTAATTTVVAGTSVNLSAQADDADGNVISGLTYTWSASGGTLSAATGSGVTWSATAAGGYSVTATATQSGTTKTGSVTIAVTTGPLAGVTVTPAAADVAMNGTLALSAQAVDAHGNPIAGATYAWSATGGSLSAAGGASTSYTAGAVSGAYRVHVTASAGGVSASASAAITVTPSFAVTTTTLTQATQGVAYEVKLQVAGGVSRYVWSLASGDLPPGFGLSSGGVLSGSAASSGTYRFSVSVTDGGSPPETASQALTLTVKGTSSGTPSVTGLARASGPGTGGTIVTISGSDLTGTRVVDFGSAAGTELHVAPDGSSLTIVCPAGSGHVTVTVVTLSGRYTAGTFSYT